MNGAQVVAEMFIRYETRVVFGLPGDTTIALYDALYAESKRITHVIGARRTFGGVHGRRVRAADGQTGHL